MSKDYNAYYSGQRFAFLDAGYDLAIYQEAMPCREIDLSLASPHNQSKLVYNVATKTYNYYEYGKAHTDPQHNNAQLTFKNLIIQDTTFSQLDKNGYMIYNAIEVGRSGYPLIHGRMW